MREFTLSLISFKKDIFEKYTNKYFGCGDTVKIDFFINAKEYQEKHFNNLFIETLVVKKKNKNKTIDMFGYGNSNFLNAS